MILKNKKKVLYIHHSAYLGGAPRSLKLLIDDVVRSGTCDVELFILKKGESAKILNNSNVNVSFGERLFPCHASTVSGKSIKMSIRNFIGFFSNLLNFKVKNIGSYDVVHLNSTCLFQYAWMVKLKSKRTKVICHVREPVLDTFTGKVLKYFIRNYCDGIVAISKYDLESLGKVNLPCKVVHNYIDVPDELNINNRYNNGTFVVGYFARLDTKNGILDFIELAKVNLSNRHLKFVIYGLSGNETDDVRIALEDRPVNLLINPMVSNVMEYISKCHLNISPFLVPHFSRSVVESAALGVPSIVYNVDSLNELVDHGVTGYVVEKGDINTMSNLILSLSNDFEAWKVLSSNAYQAAKVRFSRLNSVRIMDTYND